MTSSRVNGTSSDHLTYYNKNCYKCHKRAGIQWSLPTNSLCRGDEIARQLEAVQMDNVQIANEQLQFLIVKIQKLETDIMFIKYGLIVALIVFGSLLVMKM
ncbi:unnamed protein product [Camellia sinensis]